MSLFSQPLESITEADLVSLRENEVAEGRMIEFKAELPGGSDAEKLEFLADASSFPNAAGGDLLFGINDEDGVAGGLQPIAADEVDAAILRLENLLRDTIEPRLTVRSRAVPVDGGVVLIMRFPRSWTGPHLIRRGHGQFRVYSRNSNGKYPLDERELRSLYHSSGNQAERIKAFHTERIARIVAGETPVTIEDGARLILHLVPVNAFDLDVSYDLVPLVAEPFPAFYSQMGQLGQLNLDGLVVHNATGEHLASGYTQLFRSGILEALDARLLGFRHQDDEPDAVYGMPVERTLVQASERFLQLYERLGVPAPIVALATLIGVKGWTIRTADPFDLIRNRYFDRDLVQLPDVIFDDLRASTGPVLRPAIDTMWQAAGFLRSPNYDEEGEWHEPRA